jgi:geranylgeranylglycerol-phosphate geranylgeranyltransferase
MRLYYGIPMAGGFLVIVFYRIAGGANAVTGKLLLSFFAVVLIISGGYALNDACDLAADRINCPGRILPSERLKQKTAVLFSAFLFLAGLGLGAMCNFRFMAALFLITIGLIVYDIISKKIGFLKDMFVAVLMTALYPLATTLVEPIPGPRLSSLSISPFWLFFTTLGYEMLKDVRDHRGDQVAGDGGIAAISGRKWFLILAGVFAVVGSLISLIPYILGYCREVYLAFSVIGNILCLLCISMRSFRGLPFLYGSIFLITLGAFLDLLIYGALK